MGELTVGRESLAQARAREGVEALLARHWHEIALYKDIPLDVDWEAYEAAEAAGKLRIFTVRDGGTLVGYAVYAVAMNLHYKGSSQAVQDVLFLASEYRRGTAGAQLILYADTALIAEGVQVTYHHSKVAHPLDLLLRRKGYELVETVWAKRHDRR